MKEKPANLPARGKTSLYKRIRQILESARTNVYRAVNTTQVISNWLIGRGTKIERTAFDFFKEK
jgi:hypothetical protein